MEERRRRPGGGRAPPSPIRIGVGGRPAFLLPLFSFLPLLLQLGKGGILLPVGLGLPLGRAIERAGPPLLHSFIYGGGGHPIDTQVDCLAMCGAPSTDFHLGHIVVVLRRSPASVTSSSPSPCRRADETLPRPQLDQEFEGCHRAKRVQITEVSCVRYLIRLRRIYFSKHYCPCFGL